MKDGLNVDVDVDVVGERRLDVSRNLKAVSTTLGWTEHSLL